VSKNYDSLSIFTALPLTKALKIFAAFLYPWSPNKIMLKLFSFAKSKIHSNLKKRIRSSRQEPTSLKLFKNSTKSNLPCSYSKKLSKFLLFSFTLFSFSQKSSKVL
jgi:hypothetical protein